MWGLEMRIGMEFGFRTLGYGLKIGYKCFRFRISGVRLMDQV